MASDGETSHAPAAAAAANGNDQDLKLIVLNYGKWKDAKAMEDLLRENNVAFTKIQKARQLTFGFVHFATREQRDAAFPVMQTLEWNGEMMEVKDALPKKSLKPMRSKRGRQDEDEDDDKPAKAAATAESAPAPKDARDVVTPWANIPYEEQLQRKEDEMKKVLVKITRQARKEFGKKEKRVAIDARNIARKKRKQGEAAAPTSTDPRRQGIMELPDWLQSHGSLYIVADGVLYSRPHESVEDVAWTRVTDAKDMNAIVSFGSDLVGASSDNSICVLKQEVGEEQQWVRICSGPSAAITSLASLRGFLLCCTAEGQVLKQEGTGRFASGVWKELGTVEGAKTIAIHNAFVYAHAPTNTQSQWWRAPLDGDALETLAFAPYALELATNPLGLASHNTQLIVLSQEALYYVSNEAVVKNTVPLTIEGVASAKITGFASHKGLCCPMDSIHGSPQTEGYRNKCEFSIGFDAEGQPCIGFRLGMFREGSVVVSKPDDCINVSVAMKQICAAMQEVMAVSGLPVYDVKTQKGVWRMLTVRESERTKTLMLMVQINPDGLSPEELETLKQLLIQQLTDASRPFKITSLYLQEYTGVSAPSEDDPVTKIHGDDSIEEHLLGMRFSVSPNAFFQVNTPGAETLYSLVKKHARADANTLLYDVCCGTGTIGICASEGVGKVVGIEICKAATDDAAVNAKLNGVENISFINSKAEDVMKELLRKKRAENEMHINRVVAIVDPPRAGLHHQVLRSLRGCPPVERIVYVSCNPTNSLITDAMTLCGPNTKAIQGEGFKPVYAIPVDMFPHTPHCEMIIVFDRERKHRAPKSPEAQPTEDAPTEDMKTE